MVRGEDRTPRDVFNIPLRVKLDRKQARTRERRLDGTEYSISDLRRAHVIWVRVVGIRHC